MPTGPPTYIKQNVFTDAWRSTSGNKTRNDGEDIIEHTNQNKLIVDDNMINLLAVNTHIVPVKRSPPTSTTWHHGSNDEIERDTFSCRTDDTTVKCSNVVPSNSTNWTDSEHDFGERVYRFLDALVGHSYQLSMVVGSLLYAFRHEMPFLVDEDLGELEMEGMVLANAQQALFHLLAFDRNGIRWVEIVKASHERWIEQHQRNIPSNVAMPLQEGQEASTITAPEGTVDAAVAGDHEQADNRSLESPEETVNSLLGSNSGFDGATASISSTLAGEHFENINGGNGGRSLDSLSYSGTPQGASNGQEEG